MISTQVWMKFWEKIEYVAAQKFGLLSIAPSIPWWKPLWSNISVYDVYKPTKKDSFMQGKFVISGRTKVNPKAHLDFNDKTNKKNAFFRQNIFIF